MTKFKLFLLTTLPILIIVGILLAIFISTSLRNGTREIILRKEEHVVQLSNELVHNTKEISKQVEILASLLSSQKGNSTDAFLEKLMNEIPMIQAIVIGFDPEFLAECAQGKHTGYRFENFFGLLDQNRKRVPEAFAPAIYRKVDGTYAKTDDAPFFYQTRDWFLIPKLAKTGKWTNCFMTRMCERQVTAYGLPFYYENKFVGVVTIFAKIEMLLSLQEDIRANGITNQGTTYFVIAPNGRVIYHSKLSPWPRFSIYSVLREIDREEVGDQIDAMISGVSGMIRIPQLASFEFHDMSGGAIDIWLVHSMIRNGTGWILVEAVDESLVLSRLYRKTYGISLAIIAASLLLSGIMFSLLVQANKPLLEMTQVVRQVAQGNLDARVSPPKVSRQDELGGLIEAFNDMVSKLQLNTTKMATESARRQVLEKELMFAHQLQDSFLPSDELVFSAVEKFTVKSQLLPATYVAGDFYDFWWVSENTIALLIADVSGKGAAAAMVMVAARTMIRQVANVDRLPGEILTEVNRLLQATNENSMFVTLFFLYYNIETGHVYYCNAGHSTPYIVQPNGMVEPFEEAISPLLGIIPGADFTTQESVLDPGQLLFLYTDGVTDVVSETGEQFGINGLRELLTSLARHSSVDFLDSALQRIIDYSTKKRADDITMLILKRHE